MRNIYYISAILLGILISACSNETAKKEEDIEKTVLAHEKTQEQLQGRQPKKVIVVPGRIVNIVG